MAMLRLKLVSFLLHLLFKMINYGSAISTSQFNQ